jgi:hypothetical protein
VIIFINVNPGSTLFLKLAMTASSHMEHENGSSPLAPFRKEGYEGNFEKYFLRKEVEAYGDY